MNVLIVHDRQEIGDEIVKIAHQAGGEIRAILALDGASARAAMEKAYFDLLILDLTIPNIHGRGDVGFHVAEGLLEELFGAQNMMQPGSVLGITQDAGALDRIQTTIRRPRHQSSYVSRQ